jgi:translation initiation factor IF-2
MIDKRFWACAILAVTVVVAVAGSLPSLLLRPIAADPPPVALAPAANVAEPAQAPVQAKADPAPVAPAAAAAVAAVAAAAAAVAVAEPSKPGPPPAPHPAAAPPSGPAPVRESGPAFPPVQPVGVATPAQPVATPPPDAAIARMAVPASEKTARPQRTARQTAARQKRKLVRPAPYPMREFFAWRR